jgi:hypothetical protein
MPPRKNGKSRLTTPWDALGPIDWGGDLTGTRLMSVTTLGFEPWTYGEAKQQQHQQQQEQHRCAIVLPLAPGGQGSYELGGVDQCL